jgi:hypothetical protein
MKWTTRDPKKLKPYKKNSKPHTKEQVEALAGMIKDQGFDQPIVITSKNIIIKGHGRREASLLLGLDEVPVVVRDDLSKEEADLSRIVDNESVDTEWDAMSLSLELNNINSGGGDMQGTLLSSDYIDDLLGMSPSSGMGSSEVNLDNIETKHECDSCGYRW